MADLVNSAIDRALNKYGRGGMLSDLGTGLSWTYNAARSPYAYLFNKTSEALYPDRVTRKTTFSPDEFLTSGRGAVFEDTGQDANDIASFLEGQQPGFWNQVRSGQIGTNLGRVDIGDSSLSLNPLGWGINVFDFVSNPLEFAGLFSRGGDLPDLVNALKARRMIGVGVPFSGGQRIGGSLQGLSQAARGTAVQKAIAETPELADWFTRGTVFNRNPLFDVNKPGAYAPLRRLPFEAAETAPAARSVIDEILEATPRAEAPAVVQQRVTIDDILGRQTLQQMRPDLVEPAADMPLPPSGALDFMDAAPMQTAGVDDLLQSFARQTGQPRADIVFRMDEPGDELGWVDKPQGLYLNRLGDNTGVEDTMAVRREFKWHPAKELDLSDAKHGQRVSHRRGGGFSFEPSVGIKALRELTSPDEFNALMSMSKKDALQYAKELYPEVEWGKYYDSYEILEGIAGRLARDAGYDALIDSRERVALLESAISSTGDSVRKSSSAQAVDEIMQPAAAPAAQDVGAFFETNYDRLLSEAQAMLAKRGFTRGAEDAAADIVGQAFETASAKGFRDGADPWKYIRSTMEGKTKNFLRKGARDAGRAGSLSADIGDEGGALGDLLAQSRYGDPVDVAATRESLRASGDADLADAVYDLRQAAPAERRVITDAISQSKHVNKVEDLGDGSLRLTMNNGRTGTVRFMDEIASPMQAAGYASTEGQQVAGRFVVDFGGDGVIDLTRFATKATPDHEMVHWAKRLGLFSDDEWARLGSRYGEGATDAATIEERIAAGLAGEDYLHRGLIQRIKDFFVGLYESVSGKVTESGAVRRWQSGEVWSRNRPLPDDIWQKKARAFVTETARNRKAVTRETAFVPELQKAIRRQAAERRATASKRFSLVTDEAAATTDAQQSALVRARGHVKGVSDIEVKPTLVDQLLSKEGRSAIGVKVRKALWDEVHPLRRLMYESVGGKDVFRGRAAAHVLLQNVNGLLSNGRRIVTQGILDPLQQGGKYLWKGNMASDILNPAVDYLRSMKSHVTEEMVKNVLHDADSYMVAKRLRWLHTQASDAARVMAETGAYDQPSVLLERGILQQSDLDKLVGMSQDDAMRSMQGKIDEWAGKAIGWGVEESDLDLANRVIGEIEADGGKWDAVEKIRGVVRGINEAKVKYARAKGLLSDEQAAMLLEQADDYAPLMRVMDEGEGVAGMGGDLYNTLKGSSRQILNPVTSTVESTVNWMRRADLNEVYARWVTDVDADTLASMGVRQVDEAGPNTHAIFLNGEKTFWQFDDAEVLDSIQRVGRAEPRDILTRILGAYQRIVRESVTHSPGFAVRNFIRDSFMRTIISDSGSGLLSGFRGIDPEEMDAFIKSGGDQAGFYGKVSDAYADEMQRSIREVAKDKSTIMMSPRQLKDFVVGKWDAWGDIVSRGEQQNRLAEFRTAVQKIMADNPGMEMLEAERLAAYRARKLMDFAIMGTAGRKINAVIPFFNPAVQGTRVLLGAAMKDPSLFAKRLAMYVGMPSIGAYLYNQSVGAGQEYVNLPAYRRDLYWNFKVGNRWVVIPKPFEAGVLGTAFERAVDLASGNTKAFEGVLPGVRKGSFDAGTLLKSASPVDEALLAGPMKPLIELMTNRDLFRDSYIIPPYEEGLDVSLRKGASNASSVGRAISAITGQIGLMSDPRQADHLINSLLADFGRAVTRGPDASVLTGGFTRESSPWQLMGVQDALDEASRKGLSRRKEHRAFVDSIRQTDANPTRANLDSLLRKAEKELDRVGRISIDDILKERKGR